jgi:hypothetical protein
MALCSHYAAQTHGLACCSPRDYGAKVAGFHSAEIFVSQWRAVRVLMEQNSVERLNSKDTA